MLGVQHFLQIQKDGLIIALVPSSYWPREPQVSQQLKVFLGFVILAAAVIIAATFLFSRPSQDLTSQLADSQRLVRQDSHQVATTSAQLSLVEFSDFQCPACGAAHPVVFQIIEDYQGELSYAFRHFPLPQHKNAQIAAEAAEAAGEQGMFFEMADRLLGSQDEWSESNKPLDIFIGYAQELGLDVDQFRQAVESHKFADKIRRDQNDGQALGVDSTPTFFINGQKVSGVPTYDQFRETIENLL